MASYVLAIDQGTTSTRAMLFRADTSVAAVAQREFPQHFPAGGEVQHEPEDLWAKTVETWRSARRDAGARAADIAAIGMASTIGRMARGTPNSASSSARSACGQSDCMAARRSAVWKQTPRLRLPENNRRKRHVLPTLQRCDALAQRLARPILV